MKKKLKELIDYLNGIEIIKVQTMDDNPKKELSDEQLIDKMIAIIERLENIEL